MSAIALVQARTGSARLPSKILMPLNRLPMVVRVAWRTQMIPGVGCVVICTTRENEDGRIRDVVWDASGPSVQVFRAPQPDDVLGRFALAALDYPADTYIRITADCPLLDPWLAGRMLAIHEAHGNSLTYNTPGLGWLDGLDVEIFSRRFLFEALSSAQTPEELEHVTGWMRKYWPTRCVAVSAPDEALEAFAALPERYRKWSVDTREEYDRVARIYDELPEGAYGWRDTVAAIGGLIP